MARYQVFISSTFDDLKDERHCLWQRLTDHNYIVAGMENFPSTSEEPFEYIKPLIDESDYFLLIIGDRYGTDFLNSGKSYTETEFEYALEKEIPILAFPIDELTARKSRKMDIDEIRSSKLQEFRARATSGRMVRTWSTPEDLASVAIQALSFEGSRKSRPGWVRGNELNLSRLNEDLSILRKENDILRKKVKTQPDLSFDEMKSALDVKHEFQVHNERESEDVMVNITLRNILMLEPIFEEVSFESLVESIQIVCATEYPDDKYIDDLTITDQLAINDVNLDAIILFLKRIGVIDFSLGDTKGKIKRGRNWLLANEVAKMGNSQHKFISSIKKLKGDEID